MLSALARLTAEDLESALDVRVKLDLEISGQEPDDAAEDESDSDAAAPLPEKENDDAAMLNDDLTRAARVHSLLALVAGPHESSTTTAIACLRVLSRDDAYAHAIIEAGGLQILGLKYRCSSLATGHGAVQIAQLEGLISNLCLVDAAPEHMLAEGLVPVVIEMLERACASVHRPASLEAAEVACIAVRNLCSRSAACRGAVREAQGIRALTAALELPALKAQTAAAWALLNACMDEKSAEEARTGEALKALAGVLEGAPAPASEAAGASPLVPVAHVLELLCRDGPPPRPAPRPARPAPRPPRCLDSPRPRPRAEAAARRLRCLGAAPALGKLGKPPAGRRGAAGARRWGPTRRGRWRRRGGPRGGPAARGGGAGRPRVPPRLRLAPTLHPAPRPLRRPPPIKARLISNSNSNMHTSA
eukprot:tig00021612_g22870.t1